MLVVGIARSGVAAALALRARGEEVIAVDAAGGSGAGALAAAGVESHLHDDGVALLQRVNAVVKSPGVPAQEPVIAAARERGIPVLGELELAWRMLANEFIAVTGTNGKTTTVELIGHVHRVAGLEVAVAGNVGTPLSSLAGSIAAGATVVCEASSFQLEDTLLFAPEAAVLLNVSEDHLDRHGTMSAYLAAKLEIFARQGPQDLAVLPSALQANGRPLHEGLAARVIRFGDSPGCDLEERAGELWWEGSPLMALGELGLRGRHNLENAMAAAAVCLARGIEREAVSGALRSFPGVRHRLEEVAQLDGVLYVNDSKATNIASTIVALRAFTGAPRRAPVHLILGGQGKGQDFSALREAVAEACSAVYLIGEDAPAIAAALEGVDVALAPCGLLERAVEEARRAARRGDVVLLSPACASFDQFRDFEERGERFRELVGGD